MEKPIELKTGGFFSFFGFVSWSVSTGKAQPVMRVMAIAAIAKWVKRERHRCKIAFIQIAS
jgi:hypothetical protein